MNNFKSLYHKRLYQAPTLYVYPCLSIEGVVRVLGCMLLHKFFRISVKFDVHGNPLYFYKF